MRAEPAPVDGVLAIVMAVAAVTNRLELRRVPLSMLALCSIFIALNLLASMEAIESNTAAQVPRGDRLLPVHRDLDLRLRGPRAPRAPGHQGLHHQRGRDLAWSSSLALYVSFPGSDLLLSIDGERARGLFKDANVYGPYLIPAALILAQESLQPRLLQAEPPDADLLLQRARGRDPVLVLARRVAEPGDRDHRDDRSRSRCAAAARGARS